jgi:hypothetical protein
MFGRSIFISNALQFKAFICHNISLCNLTNPRALWEKFKESISEDFKKSKGLITTITTRVLRSIASTLKSMEKDINTYCLVDYKITFDEAKMGSKEISDELHILVSLEDLLAVKIA